MRKKEQLIFTGAIIGIGVSSLIDFILQLIESKNQGEKLTWDNYDFQRTIKNAAFGGTVGAAAGYSIYKLNSFEDSAKAFKSDQFLGTLLRNEDLKNDPQLLNVAIQFRDYLKLWIVKEFGEKLASLPENAGSFVKRTANLTDLDVDIIVPFKKESFTTLEDMYLYTLRKIENKFASNATISGQTKAITITIEKHGKSIKFDIVPGREINNYQLDKDLNLYVNPSSIWTRGSSLKINTGIQRSMTINKPQVRTILRLIKLYNKINSLGIPKIILEQSVVEAMDDRNFGVYTSNTDNLLNCMDFLSNVLIHDRYIDHANSNNNLLEKMSNSERQFAFHLLQRDLIKIEKNPRYLMEIFSQDTLF
jgi:hypothetical protein